MGGGPSSADCCWMGIEARLTLGLFRILSERVSLLAPYSYASSVEQLKGGDDGADRAL
jgi:hypothetical protein